MRVLLVLLLLSTAAMADSIGMVGASGPVVGDATQIAAASAERLLSAARSFKDMGHWDEAVTLYAEYLIRRPTDEQAQFGDIWCRYYAAGGVSNATACRLAGNAWRSLAQSATDATVQAEAAYEAASAYLIYPRVLDNAQRAWPLLTALPEEWHGHRRIVYMKALSKRAQGQSDQAAVLFARFVNDSSPEESWHGDAAYYRAECLVEAADEIAAASAYHNFAEAHPGHRWAEMARYKRAYARIVRKIRTGTATAEDLRTIKALIQRFRDEHPDSPLIPYAVDQLATLLAEEGYTAKARTAYQFVIDNYPDYEHISNVQAKLDALP